MVEQKSQRRNDKRILFPFDFRAIASLRVLSVHFNFDIDEVVGWSVSIF